MMGGRVGGRRSSIPLLVAFFLGAASPALARGTIDQVGGGERGDTTMVGRDTIVDLDPLVVSVTQLDILRSRLPNSVSVVSRMRLEERDRKSTRLNSSHVAISYAVFCLIKKTRTA